MTKSIKKRVLILCYVLMALLSFVLVLGSHTSAHAKTINYMKPSENKPYPDVSKHPNMWIHVSLKKQRVYLMDGNKQLYKMYCSSGANNATPTGTYHIEDLRGDHFFSSSEGVGANYYVAWKGNDFLFHSVPVNSKGQYIKKQASYLGKKPASHGCIRLSVADAKWMYQNIPTNTKVVITKS